MRLRDLIFISVIVGGGLALARGSLKPVVSGYWPSAGPSVAGSLDPVVADSNASFQKAGTARDFTRRRPRTSWRSCAG